MIMLFEDRTPAHRCAAMSFLFQSLTAVFKGDRESLNPRSQQGTLRTTSGKFSHRTQSPGSQIHPSYGRA